MRKPKNDYDKTIEALNRCGGSVAAGILEKIFTE